jgi:pimeloyl-ACP methyl ester carboxylesterase
MIAWRRATLTVDTHTIATFEAGSLASDAPVVFLIHGLAHWTEGAWSPLVERLPAEMRVAALDLPGFGASAKPDVRYDLPFFARAVDAALDALAGDRPVVVIGHSLGGMIAADLAARRPERVAGLVLVDPAGFLSMPDWLYGVMRAPLLEALFTRIRPNAWYVSRQVAQSVRDPRAIGPENRARWIATLQDRDVRRTIARVYAGALQQIRAIGMLHRHFARYTGPAFVVWGRYDRYIAVAALAEAQRVYPQAETLVCEESAHCPAIEEPDLVADRVARFVRATSRPFDLR